MLFSRGSAHEPSRAMMKITGYRLLRSYHHWGRPIGDVNGFVDSGITEVPIVIVDTDEGISGVATGSHEGIERIFPAILGQDPRAVSTLYDRMLARVFKAGHGEMEPTNSTEQVDKVNSWSSHRCHPSLSTLQSGSAPRPKRGADLRP